MSEVRTYNPKQVKIVLGNHIVSGYAEDSFVKVEPSGDGTTKKVGCDSEVVRSISVDKTAKVTLTLLQTSSTSTFLRNMYAKDQEEGTGDFPIMVKDLMGGLLFQADTAWVAKNAAVTYGKEAENREWEIDTGECTFAEAE